jgi:hypothetical protein
MVVSIGGKRKTGDDGPGGVLASMNIGRGSELGKKDGMKGGGG